MKNIKKFASKKNKLATIVTLMITAVILAAIFNPAVVGDVERMKKRDMRLEQPSLAYKAQMEDAKIVNSNKDTQISTVSSSLTVAGSTDEDPYEVAHDLLVDAVHQISQMSDEEIESEKDKVFQSIRQDAGPDVATLLDSRKSEMQRAIATLNILGYNGDISYVSVRDSIRSNSVVSSDKPMLASLSDPLMNNYRKLGLTLDEIEDLLNQKSDSCLASDDKDSFTSAKDDDDDLPSSDKLQLMPKDGFFSSNAASPSNSLSANLNQALIETVSMEMGIPAEITSMMSSASTNVNPAVNTNTVNDQLYNDMIAEIEPQEMPQYPAQSMPRDCDFWENLYNALMGLLGFFADMVLIIGTIANVVGQVIQLVGTVIVYGLATLAAIILAPILIGTLIGGGLLFLFSGIMNGIQDILDGLEFPDDFPISFILDNFFPYGWWQHFFGAFDWTWNNIYDPIIDFITGGGNGGSDPSDPDP